MKRSKLKSNKELFVSHNWKTGLYVILGPEYLQRRVSVSSIFRDESCGVQGEERKLVGHEEGAWPSVYFCPCTSVAWAMWSCLRS